MLKPGANIDRWVIDRKLGAGGMGEVYLCHDSSDPEVRAAIKVLNLESSAENQQRFLREAKVLGDLDHAFICSFLDYGEYPAYIAMELVEGQTLTDRIAERGKVTVIRALEIVRQVCEALSYIHARDVWHRDIKPENVMIRPDGWIKLVDFGIAVQKGGQRLTMEGGVAGTLPYIPPEAMEDVEPDPARWDLYGVGVLLYEALTGTCPFQPLKANGKVDFRAAWVQKAEAEFLDPGEEFDEPVRKLVRDLTASDPAKRIRSAGQVGRRLQELQARLTAQLPQMKRQEELTPPPAPVAPAPVALAPVPPAPRRSALDVALGALGGAGITAVGLVVVAAVIALGWWFLRPSEAPSLVEARVTASGVSGDVQLFGRIAEQHVTGQAGQPLLFTELSPGKHDIWLAAGAECETLSCPGPDCDACCTWTIASRTIESSGQEILLPLTQPPELPVRELRLTVAGSIGSAGEVRLGDQVAAIKDGVAVLSGESLGEYQLQIDLGRCGNGDAGCTATDSCPAGCASVVETLRVPCGAGAWRGTVDVDAPDAPKTARRGIRTVEPEGIPAEELPEEEEKPAELAAKSLVTTADFGTWVDGHKEWSKRKAAGSDRADGAYLQDWSNRGPPAGVDARPMLYASWHAAKAFCDDRGGLPSAAAIPKARGYHEWRICGGEPCLLRSTAEVRTQVSPKQSSEQISFRCVF